MTMFSKLKQFKDLRAQAKTLQSALSTESAAGSAAGGKIKLSMDGNLRITNFEIDAELLRPEHKKKVEDGVKELFEEVNKKIQRVMATKVKEMGGLDKFKM